MQDDLLHPSHPQLRRIPRVNSLLPRHHSERGPHLLPFARKKMDLLPHRLAASAGTRFLFLRWTPGLMLLPNGLICSVARRSPPPTSRHIEDQEAPLPKAPFRFFSVKDRCLNRRPYSLASDPLFLAARL